jgi:hypothetical protein
MKWHLFFLLSLAVGLVAFVVVKQLRSQPHADAQKLIGQAPQPLIPTVKTDEPSFTFFQTSRVAEIIIEQQNDLLFEVTLTSAFTTHDAKFFMVHAGEVASAVT